MLRTVGEAALRVSRRRLAPFPRMRGCSVLMDSLGRAGCWRGGGIIGSEAVMVDMADDCEYGLGMEGCDGWIVESIMCAARRAGGERAGR